MADVTFRRGSEANLPTQGMAEDGCVYQSIDTGNIYIGGGEGNLIPVNRSPYYGVCSTLSSDSTKIVTLDVENDNFFLTEGTLIAVKFLNKNTALSPTLNVNGTGAVSVKRYETTGMGNKPSTSWNDGEVVAFVYDGEYWRHIGFNTMLSFSDIAESPIINNKLLESKNPNSIDSAEFELPIVTYDETCISPISNPITGYIDNRNHSWVLTSGSHYEILLSEDIVGIKVEGSTRSQFCFLNENQLSSVTEYERLPSIIDTSELIETIKNVPVFSNSKTYLYVKATDRNGNNVIPRKITYMRLRDKDKMDKVYESESGNVAIFDGSGGVYDSGVWIEDLVNAQPDLVVPTTYGELVNLKTGGNLVPGMKYRITDYTCTTTQANTQSAGHPFDIIVTADSETELNENARAAHRSGDTYFQNCDLDSWELKYCLENDTNRFAWADANSNNGKGVIYYMKDVFDNECPYDFKNIQFTVGGTNYYTFDALVNSVHNDLSVAQTSKGCYGNIIEEYYTASNNVSKLTLGSNIFKNTSSSSSCYSNTLESNCHNNTFGNSCYANTFRNGCQNNTFGNYCRQITVFGGVKNCQITGGTSSSNYVQNAEILEGVSGSSSSSNLTITFAKNKSYTQIAALRDGTGTPAQRLVIWDATVQADWDQTTTTAKDYIKNKPENLSDFTNDVGFITSADLPTNTSDLTNDGSDGTSTYVELDELATVATTGDYNDLTNTPTIPAAQVQSNWEDTSGMGEILHKPSFNGTVLEANDWDTALYDLPVITHDVSKVYSDYTSITGIIESPALNTTTWTNTGAHIEIPITPDLVGIEITGCSPSGYETRYAFLVEDQLQSGQTAPPEPTTITAGGTVRVSVPYGKDYIYIQTNNGTYHTRPTSIKLIMLNQEDSGYVHIAGSETITGQKTFTSDVVLWNGSQSSGDPTPYLEFRKERPDDNKHPDWKIRGDGTGSLTFYSSISGADTKQVTFDAEGSVTITGAKNITSLRIGYGNVDVLKGSITANKNITATVGSITAPAGDVIAGGNGRFKGLMYDSNSGTGTGHYIMSYQYHSLVDSTNSSTYQAEDTMPVTSKNVVKYVGDYVTTAIGNIPSTHYWANQSVQSSRSYITTPEFKQVTINGSTTDAPSTDHCIIVYDTVNKCLKFTF